MLSRLWRYQLATSWLINEFEISLARTEAVLSQLVLDLCTDLHIAMQMYYINSLRKARSCSKFRLQLLRCSSSLKPLFAFPAPLIAIGEDDDLLYGIFISYYPFKWSISRPTSDPQDEECLAPINKGNIYLNVAAPEIYHLIDQALGNLMG